MIQEDSGIKTLVTVSIPLIISLTLLIVFFGKDYFSRKSRGSYKIGILQTTSHKSLDHARNGFMEYLEKYLPINKKISFVFKKGNGSISNLQIMAKKLQSKVDFFYAIGTPAAQAIANIEKKKPIVIAAVTDAKAANLIYPGSNVCGTSDMINIKNQIAMIVQLVPKAKKVALIYNPDEVNSVVQIEEMEKELLKQNLKPFRFCINSKNKSKNKINYLINIATKKTDVLLTPTDNFIVSAMPTIASLALKAKKALFVSDKSSVELGAMASVSIDYYEQGKLSGIVLQEIIVDGKKPENLPIRVPKRSRFIVNYTTLKALQLTIPKQLLTSVKLVK